MAKLVDKAKEFVAEKMKQPEATIEDVDLVDVSSEAITYKAKVSVKNPYSLPIPIHEVSYNLKSKGRVIASGTVPHPGTLKADDSTLLTVEMKVTHDVMVSLAGDVGADWDIDYELEMGLKVDLPLIKNFTIPITSKGEIRLPTLYDPSFPMTSEGEIKLPTLSSFPEK
ncbi:desiccation protectant protein Lea14 homolog [Rhododendron vialii]|uniref:desiccation protectant protein Lea14 homolog n=1 Tax=Rhododendron vialii TaxID=182163 RepID=UPI00265DC962|nr:desiccation protectant protein Lea14 homolog [Rhododendron vialii]